MLELSPHIYLTEVKQWSTVQGPSTVRLQRRAPSARRDIAHVDGGARPTRLTKIDPALRRIAAVVVLGIIMSILDTTIVIVAVDTLGREFDTTLSSIQWVSTGYLLALSTVIPLSGWAVERFGAKRMWMISLIAVRPRLGAVRARLVGAAASSSSASCRASAAA